MKNIIILLIIIFASSSSFAQVVPYSNDYTVPDFRKHLLGGSQKSQTCNREFLERAQALLKDTLVITKENIAWVLQYVYKEEMTLPEKGYENTNWDKVSQSLVPCVGHYYHGFCFVLRIGSYEEVIAKGNCFNFIKFQLTKAKAPESVPSEKEEKGQNNNDCCKDTLVIVVVGNDAPAQESRGDVYAYDPPRYEQRGDAYAYRSPDVYYDNYQCSGGYADRYYDPSYQDCSQQQYDNYDYQYQDPGRNPMSGSRGNYGPMSGSRGNYGPMSGSRGGQGTMGGSRGGQGTMGGGRGGSGPSSGHR